MTNSEAQSTPTHFLVTRPIFANYQAIFGAGPQAPAAAGGITRSLVNIVVESGGATLLTLLDRDPRGLRIRVAAFPIEERLFLHGARDSHASGLRDAHSALQDHERSRTGEHLPRLILVYASGFMPLAMWIMYNVFLALPPSIEEAAVIDGASMLQTFYRVALPIARPGIAATAIITFLLGWGQFIFPLVLSSTGSTQPLTVVLASLEGRHVVPYTIVNAAAIVAIAIPAVLVFLLNRWIVEGIIAGSVK